MAAKLEVRGLTKRFEQGTGSTVPVFAELSFEVANLEFLAIVGPSGCGKSTLLRIIDGLVPADAGAVFLDAKEVTGSGHAHGMGFVFQSFDLFPWLTARGNVEFGMRMLNLDRRECRERGSHYIELVGLSGFEDAYPYELSGGMQQRVGIARALAIHPEVLLMDEPFGSLDVQTRDLLQDELLRIWQQEKKTVIFVTHSIEEALYLGDRILVLSPRPSQIDRVIDVPFARPRADDIKTSPEFLEARREIWALLKRGAHI